VRAALNLSLSRAEAVKQSLVDFAKQQNVNLVADQLQPTGAGISEPLIPKPKDFDEALQNMRVEFRIVRVPAETLQEADFSF
jgi:outer membrane protein OmpA-like peptidoglycan-associated protein